MNGQFRARRQSDRGSAFQAYDSTHQSARFHRLQFRGGQAGEASISFHEPAQGSRARLNHAQAAMHVVFPIRRARLPHQHAFQRASHGFDGSEGIIELVSEDPNQSLPRLALFFAQGPAQIRQDQELMRHPALPEGTAAHTPAACPTGEGNRKVSGGFAFEAIRQSQFCRRPPQNALAGLTQQPLTRAIHQPQAVRTIESEDGDIDFLHHFAQ